MRWNDFSWELDLIQLRYCATLNMTGPEQAYWMVRLLHENGGVKIDHSAAA